MLTLKQKSVSLLASLVLTSRLAAPLTLAAASTPGQTWQAPAALALSSDGRQLFAACARAHRVLVLNSETLAVSASIALPDMPTGLVLSTNGRTLYVTCAAPAGSLVVLDIPRRKILRRIAVGHTAMAPVLSPDEKTAYVCNRFNNDLSVINLASGKETSRITVDREPVAAALTPNGKLLVVANHLHSGRADTERVAARVSLIDTVTGKLLKHLPLPNGSGLLNDVAISPDGRYACVTHVLGRFQLPTTQVERGWINSNALTLIDLETLAVLNTVLIDNAENGAANPWTCGWSPDGTMLFVTHAGTHEVSLIDFSGLLERLARLPVNLEDRLTADYTTGSRVKADVPNDLAFLTGLRERIKLNGKGPRAAVAKGTRLYVASFFSDTVEVVDLQRSQTPLLLQARLTADLPMSEIRRGELFFNDGSLCFQGWQSCASCHSDDARVDGLNWDLLNDGIGNPKNTKSMLLAHRTPPAMSLGVRDTAETAVRAGLRSILFTVQPEEIPRAIDTYLKSLTPIPSPIVVSNVSAARIKAGEKIFNSTQAGCSACHPRGLFTDLQHYDVGTQNQTDKPGEAFDTPTLVEIWRTAPYLHDGSAATLREVLVDHNPSDRHGSTSHLTPGQLDALISYLLSL
jgi:YVTN family beta-propeller protein